MTLTPHYVQTGSSPAVVGEGYGLFACACGQSLLIAGYEPRNFLCIAIQCSTCGRVSETPGLAPGARPPPGVTLIERGAEQPPATVSAGTVLISREEMGRLAALYLPRKTDQDLHVISAEVLDGVETMHRRWTGLPLDPSPKNHKDLPLAWAVAHFRERLRVGWTTFASETDMVATTVIASFRDLLASWGHHPLFGAMMVTAEVQGFSLHATAIFGTAKALTLSGNQVAFVPTEGPRPRIASMRIGMGGPEPMSVAVNRFDRFEWPNGASTTPQAVRAAVIEAMASVQGHINRLRPGVLVLSGGAADRSFDQVLIDGIGAALASHGKRYRGIAAVAGMLPKVIQTGKPGEVKFGYVFYPAANRAHSVGDNVRIGSRADYAGLP